MIKVAACLGFTALCAAAAASSASSPGGRIVFTRASGAQGITRVWVMTANGTGQRPLTPANVNDESAVLSRDGRRVAFGRRIGMQHDLYVMNLNGSGLRRLASGPADQSSPSWSPDGRSIAYARSAAGKSDIWVMRADGSHKRRLTRDPALADTPAWSPDGRRIAYARNGRIWVMNANGSGQHALTHGQAGSGVDYAPSWSPDGRRIAFQSNRNEGNVVNSTDEIWLMSSDGTHQVRLTHNALEDNRPIWSPDGRWIAYASERPHPGPLHLWAVHPNGRGLHRVSSSSLEEYSPSWAR